VNDLVVIGAGTMGAWTALQAVRAGRRVTLVDAFGAGSPRATSGDETRISRAAHGLDRFYVRWSREARVDWPGQHAALLMRAEAPLDYFVLYSPREADHFVMEPVSNCTDWMNLAAQGIGDAGGTVLAPDETLAGRFELLPLPL